MGLIYTFSLISRSVEFGKEEVKMRAEDSTYKSIGETLAKS